MKHAILLFLNLFCILCLNAQLKSDFLNIAVDLYNNNQRDSALLIANQGIEYYKVQKFQDSLIQIRRTRATIYSSIKTPQEALEEMKEVLEMGVAYYEDGSLPLAKLYRDIGRIYNQANQLDKAVEMYNVAIKLIDPKNDTVAFKGSVLTNLAWIYLIKREYKIGFPIAEEAYDLLTAFYDSTSVKLTNIYQTMGSYYQYTGQYKASIPYLEKFLLVQQLNNPPNHPNIGIAHNDIATPYQNLGNYKKAMHHRRQCEKVLYEDYLKTGQGRYLSIAISNLGYLYLVMGERAMSLEYLEKSLKLSELDYGKDNIRMILTLSQMGTAYNIMGQTEKAKYCVEKALKIQKDKAPEDQGGIAFLNVQVSSILFAEGDYANAYQKALEAHKYYKKVGEYYSKMNVASMEHIANACRELKKWDYAIAMAKEAVNINDSIVGPIHGNTLSSNLVLSDIFLSKNDYQSAEKTIMYQLGEMSSGDNSDFNFENLIVTKECIDAITRLLKILDLKSDDNLNVKDELISLMSDFEKYYAKFITQYRSQTSIQENGQSLKVAYSTAIKILKKYPRTEVLDQTILKYTERYKSILLKVMTNSTLITNNEKDDPICLRYNYFVDSLDFINAQILESKSENTQLFIDLTNLQESYNSFKDSVYNINKSFFYEQLGFNDINNEEIKSVINDDEVMIEYMLIDSSIIQIIMDHTGELEIYEVASDSLSWIINQVNADIDSQLRKIELKKLYHLLIPKTEMIKDKNLLIIPDGELFKINYETLIDENDQYLLMSANIRYAYSAMLLGNQNKISNKAKSQIISLTPGFTDEMKQYYQSTDLIPSEDSLYLSLLKQPFMIKMLSGLSTFRKTEAYQGINATESVFEDAIGNCKILHLGTHGEIDNDSPLFSRLILAKDSIDDGYLHAYEIYGNKINADLAVLSACNTGQGKSNSGEGVISLSYAFTYAGCPSVVMSLWSIDEKSTSEILSRFYEYLAEGKRKSQALRAAKIDYLNSAKAFTVDPYYWGGLIFMGNDNPIPLKSKSSLNLIFLMVGAVIIGLIFMKLKTKNQ